MIGGPSASDAQGLPGHLSCISLGWAGPTRLGHLVRRGGGRWGSVSATSDQMIRNKFHSFCRKGAHYNSNPQRPRTFFSTMPCQSPPTKKASSLEQIFQPGPLFLSLAHPLMRSLWKRFPNEPQSHYRKKKDHFPDGESLFIAWTGGGHQETSTSAPHGRCARLLFLVQREKENYSRPSSKQDSFSFRQSSSVPPIRALVGHQSHETPPPVSYSSQRAPNLKKCPP